MEREFDALDIRTAGALMQAVLSAGHRFRFVAHGNSMNPFIRNGDVVELLSPTPPFRKGEILAVVHKERLLVHRVVAVGKQTVLLKGDSVRNPDGWIGEAEVLGRVVRVFHNGEVQNLGVNRYGKTVALFSKKKFLPIALKIYGFCFKKIKRVLDK